MRTRVGHGIAVACLSLLALAGGLAAGVAPAAAAAPSIEPIAVQEYSYVEKLRARIYPEGQATDWEFEYLTEAAYQQNLSESKPGFEGASPGPSGSSAQIEGSFVVTGALNSLEPSTTYRVRLVAENADGGGEAQGTFTTGALAPTAVTGGVTHLGAVRAQLHGSVNPNGEGTVYWFEYGLGDCEASSCAVAPASGFSTAAGGGATPFLATQAIAGLQPATTYHYRIRARNSVGGPVAGMDATFTTPPAASPEQCANEPLREAQHATFLPECRAYEMVSPPQKNGGDVAAWSLRTRAAAAGDALQFTSLGTFADAIGTGVATEYIAERASEGPGPLGTGWETHAITPPQEANTLDQLASILEPRYEGEFTAGLGKGVFLSNSALSEEDPNVSGVANLYLRTDLRTTGRGEYRLLTKCPLCAETGKPLPNLTGQGEGVFRKPVLGGLSADGSHAIFESGYALTADAGSPGSEKTRLYEWDEGTVRLAGRIPTSGTECDDAGGPACKGSDISIAGPGVEGQSSLVLMRVMHPLSDGSDGHARIFFTRPTNSSGTTSVPGGDSGRLYLREDGRYTSELNAPEGVSSEFQPAFYWDASADGERVFFMTGQRLTEESPSGGLYMYDASKPGSDPHNLTLLSGSAERVVGASADGSYVYFTSGSQLVAGAPLPAEPGSVGLYLWHEGAISYVGAVPLTGGYSYGTWGWAAERQARVSPDGRHLLFPSSVEVGLLGYESGGNNELYLYDAESSTPSEPDLRCVSCRADLGPAQADASNMVDELRGAAMEALHETSSLTVDGRRVFFSTADPLVPEDTNGKSDAYEYDAESGEVHLLSSGTSPRDSWFVDASANGDDVFVDTSEQLVGWDRDNSYDIYDVRVGGGFPEPTPQPAPCASADTCKGGAAGSPQPAVIASGLEGPGNPEVKRPRCPKGKHLKRVRGKKRCVKSNKHQSRKKHPRREAGRKGGGK